MKNKIDSSADPGIATDDEFVCKDIPRGFVAIRLSMANVHRVAELIGAAHYSQQKIGEAELVGSYTFLFHDSRPSKSIRCGQIIVFTDDGDHNEAFNEHYHVLNSYEFSRLYAVANERTTVGMNVAESEPPKVRLVPKSAQIPPLAAARIVDVVQASMSPNEFNTVVEWIGLFSTEGTASKPVNVDGVEYVFTATVKRAEVGA